jgi:phosphoribosylglycinamide formyltransferase 1
MKRIIIFASGSGSNAENIINYFNKTKTAKVVHVLCNSKKAKVFDRCERLNTPSSHFTRDEFLVTDKILNFLKENADLIVLAGFLWKVPTEIIKAFPKKILNIHPALLPKYGGKGMYGMHVHKAVADNKEKETGITIHFVNEHYDEGAIIYQAKTALDSNDTPESIAKKIHVLEQSYFPRIIEEVIISVNE